MVNRKELELDLEPEPQFVISAPGGNLNLAPRLSAPAPQHRRKVNSIRKSRQKPWDKFKDVKVY